MSTPTDSVRAELQKQLTAVATPETKEKILRLTSGANCIGVTVPAIRETAIAIKKQYVLTMDDALCLADSVFPDKCREELLAAIFMIASFPKKQLPQSITRILPWLDFLDNWETCDQLASNIAAPIIATKPEEFSFLQEFATSGSLWKRRFSAATAANSNHGKFLFPDETLSICGVLLSDNEPMIAKAVGWAIREVYKKDTEKVKAFLEEHKSSISKKLTSEIKGL